MIELMEYTASAKQPTIFYEEFANRNLNKPIKINTIKGKISKEKLKRQRRIEILTK